MLSHMLDWGSLLEWRIDWDDASVNDRTLADDHIRRKGLDLIEHRRVFQDVGEPAGVRDPSGVFEHQELGVFSNERAGVGHGNGTNEIVRADFERRAGCVLGGFFHLGHGVVSLWGWVEVTCVESPLSGSRLRRKSSSAWARVMQVGHLVVVG